MSFLDDIVGTFLGPVGGFLGGLLFPEFAIPAEIAGGFLGGTAGGLIEGKPIGQSAIQGLETGAISGATGAIGSAFGLTPSSILGGGDAAAGAGAAAPTSGVSGTSALAAPTAPVAAPTGSPIPPGAGASAAGIAGGGGGDLPFMGFLNSVNPGDTSGTTAGALNSTEFNQLSGPVSSGGGVAAGGPATGDMGLSAPSGGSMPNLSGSAPYGSPEALTGGGTTAGSGISDFFKKNWPAVAGAGILGVEALTKNSNLPQEKQLQGQANAFQSEAQALASPLQTGILPPGAKQAVDAATSAQKAAIKSNNASLGLSGSTMEAQQVGAVDRNAAAQTFQIADQLLAKGVDLAKLSSSDLQFLIEEQLKQDTQFQGALANFAGGLAGGRLQAAA